MAPQREWFEKDYYRVLGVPETASAKEIKSAYRKLSRQYHPDANEGDAAAEERFKEVSAAYDVVGNEERRKEYDEVRRLGPAAAGFPGGGGPGGFRFQDGGDLGDLLGGLFGRGGRGGRPGGGRGPHRGQDLETELHLTFDDAVAGLTTAVHLTSDAPCHTCNGSGRRAPGTSPHALRATAAARAWCPTTRACSPSRRRARCAAGAASPSTTRAPRAAAPGVERRPREVKVRIPAGVADGQRIRLKGRGGPGPERRPARRPLRRGPRVAAPDLRPQGQRPHRHGADHLPGGHPRRRHRRAHPRRRPGHRADPAGHPVGPHVPREGQGRRHRQGHRRPARHRGGGGARQAQRAPSARRSRPSKPRRTGPRPASTWGSDERPTPNARAPSTSSRWPPSWPGSTPRRCASTSARVSSTPLAPAAAAAATATRTSPSSAASRSSPTRGSTSPASRRSSSWRRSWPLSAASSSAAREAGAAAVASTHRQYRRDLVPLNQSLTIFRDR